jgi:lysyl endopeptidase
LLTSFLTGELCYNPKLEIPMRVKILQGLLYLCLFSAGQLLAQDAGTLLQKPAAQAQPFGPGDWAKIKAEKLAKFPLEKILQEDRLKPGNRFAAPIQANFHLDNAGYWTALNDGSSVWRAVISSPSALGLVLFFDQFYLPPGAELKLYAAQNGELIRTYTGLDNPAGGHYMIGPLDGNSARLEYHEPAEMSRQGRLHLFRVDHVYDQQRYQEASRLTETLGFGSSDACNININCAEGRGLDTVKRAVCRIVVVVEEGTGVCTGSLINNTREDGRPLMITAFHCMDGYRPLYNLWRFDFGYEATTCENPKKEPVPRSIIGAKMLAGRQMNDFLLLELTSPVPQSFGAYYLGWNRAKGLAKNASHIHHPRGDIKKVSLDKDEVKVNVNAIQWNNDLQTPPEHHYRFTFDSGNFDVGSSGGPLLNEKKQFIGQLHGGRDTCIGAIGFFARFDLGWDAGDSPASRLKDWLDPDNRGVESLRGIENPNKGGGSISGIVETDDGIGISRARVRIVGENGFVVSTVTDVEGYYIIDNIPFGDNYEVTVTKSDNYLNGVSTGDLIRIQKHILNIDPFKSPFLLLAADTNNSGSITTADLIALRKLILNIDRVLAAPVWLFVPSNDSFTDPNNPFVGLKAGVFNVTNFSTDRRNFDFIGVKFGDANGSVDTQF